MSRLSLAVACLVVICPVAALAQSVGIQAGATVFIERIDLLDFRAELTRQKVALKLVASAEDAQLLIVGSQATDRSMTKGERGVIYAVRRTGTVSVQDKTSSATLWVRDVAVGFVQS
jgi:hypothetical protein